MKNLSLISKMAIASIAAGVISTAIAAPCGAKCRPKCSAKMTKCGAKCGAKCSPKCGAKMDPKLIQRPAGFRENYRSTLSTIRAGEALFNSAKLSTNKLSCASCHADGASYKSSFAQPFPHKVEMAFDNYGVDKVYLDEAIQMCMLGPMASKTFAWNSPELANLVAFVSEEQKKFIKH